ncbi:MAG TPA: hypothetical protein VIA18_02350, partial [Polyangia bacterium]|nr:hypothetical protein [Polyangia bacterium]
MMWRRFLRAWPALLVVVAIAWQYRAPLVGRVWYFEDIAAYFVPLYAAAARAMHGGGFPTWDTGAWAGQPLVGDPQVGCFYPPNWLWMWVSPARLYAWLQLFHVAVGGAGMWALARTRGRSPQAAALAALTLTLGAFCVLELRHAMFVATTAWLPWLWWAIERWQSHRERDEALAIALTGGAAILAGGWSMLPFALELMLIVTAARTLATPREQRRRFVVGVALGGAGAVALAMAQLLPALAHARLSPRALGTTYAFASSYAWPSWRYAITLALPTFYGDDARHTYVGASDQWELCGYGIGLVASLLALASLVERERRRERLAIFLATVVACELALGGHGFLHPLLFRAHILSSLRCPARALYLWTLAAPLLAADGLDAVTARLPARAKTIVPALLLCAVAGELVYTWRSDNPSTTLAAADAHSPAIDWLREGHKPDRVVNDVHLPQPFHNMGLRWRLDAAGGYSSLPIWRYLHLLWIANHGKPYPHAQLNDDLTAQGLWRFSSPIVDLLGVRRVLTAHDHPITAKQFQLVYTGSDGLDVWENLDAFPRAYIVYRAQLVADEPAAARAVASPTWRPSRVAIVEPLASGAAPAPDVPAPSPTEELPDPATVRELFRIGPTRFEIEAVLAQPGILVVGEPWYPGWRATVDDRPAPVLRV